MQLLCNRSLRCAAFAAAALFLPGYAHAQITIDTSNSNVWVIGNGALTVEWMPATGHIISIRWAAFAAQELVDQTSRDKNGPKGFYMDNVASLGGPQAPGYYVDPGGTYIDFWVEGPASSAGGFSWSWHDVLFVNDPGIHMYFVLDHRPGDAAASVGQIQWVFRGNLGEFTHTYSVNTGLSNLGATAVPLPDAVLTGTGLVPGRNVQDATVDLHGLSLPEGFRRQFYTKYDYSTYEYLHQAQGVYGSTLGAWIVVPSADSLTGGPTKQDLIFTGNLLIMEAYSNHLDNQLSFRVPQDASMHRLYGPFYLHFNSFNDPDSPPGSLYEEARASADSLKDLYDQEQILLQNGYVSTADRAKVRVAIDGLPSHEPNTAWVVLSDNRTNQQYSHAGSQYWTNVDRHGKASLKRVAPGSYRLSGYVLGEWGELRADDIQIRKGRPESVSLRFTPENFGPEPPIWTIGTPDRSSHEFLHGQIENPIDRDPRFRDKYTARWGESVQDDREYWGNWNYWADFETNLGAVVYYATAVGSTPATNDLTKWNYNQWHVFNPGLYAGIFDSSDTGTDGYKFLCPSYVFRLFGSGGCATAVVPDWQVHFTTTPEQAAHGSRVVLSVGLAAAEADLTVTLNGDPLTWKAVKLADAGVRSGFSGTYQWIVFEWPSDVVHRPGEDNVITFHVNKTQGVMYDALRLEITNRGASHESTGWKDYEYVTGTSYEPAEDGQANP